MTEQINPVGSQSPRRFLHWILLAFTFFVGIEAGAGSFVTIVVFPLWAASPEAAIGWRPDIPYYLEEGDFFMFSSSITMLTAIITLIAGWRAAPPLRLWVRVSTIAFLFIAVWSILYFIPIQDVTFKGEAGTRIPRDVLEAKLQNFVLLNYVRQIILLFSFFTAIHATGLSYKAK
jgi:hypothetical protein